MHHFHKFLKDMKVDMSNKGEELLISIKGEKDKVAAVERKLKALKELCCCCCGGMDEDCC